MEQSITHSPIIYHILFVFVCFLLAELDRTRLVYRFHMIDRYITGWSALWASQWGIGCLSLKVWTERTPIHPSLYRRPLMDSLNPMFGQQYVLQAMKGMHNGVEMYRWAWPSNKRTLKSKLYDQQWSTLHYYLWQLLYVLGSYSIVNTDTNILYLPLTHYVSIVNRFFTCQQITR